MLLSVAHRYDHDAWISVDSRISLEKVNMQNWNFMSFVHFTELHLPKFILRDLAVVEIHLALSSNFFQQLFGYYFILNML